DLAGEKGRVARELESLEAQGAVPNAGELAQKRGDRDHCWQKIRAAWVRGEPIPESSPEETATLYEKRVGEADGIADRLWKDADRSSRHAALLKEEARLDQESTIQKERYDALKEEKSDQIRKWHEAWHETGITPLTPDEMRGWLARREKLMLTLEQLRIAKGEKANLSERADRFKNECSTALDALGEPLPSKEESFTSLLQRIEKILEKLEKEEQERNQARRDLEEAEAMLLEQQQTLAQHREEMKTWQSEWGKALERTGLDEKASTDEAYAYLNVLDEIIKKAEQREHHVKRMKDIRRDAEQFESSVKKLALECGFDLSQLDRDEAAYALKAKLKKGRDAHKDRIGLEQRLHEVIREHCDLGRDREDAQETLDQLMRDAGCGTLDALEEAELRSEMFREMEARLGDIEEQLLNEGVPLDALIEEAKAADPDTLPGKIEALEQEIEARKVKLAEWNVQRGRVQAELRSLDGSSKAAEAAAEAQEALAAMQSHVQQYCRFKLASMLLDQEIEQYRLENQDPILELAGEMFRTMTLNHYSCLSTGFNDSDEPILECVRADGEKVPVEGLSEGTRDQLYLALRLAGITLHVTRNEPIPVIIDDALINFDDARAEAAMGLLGRLSEKTQILFFTHHARLQEIARRALPPERLNEHILDRPPAASEKGIPTPEL
ncbi:MAG: hypothetical protein ABIK28_14175, partial [Planctomycetota bacterium]